MTQSPHKSKRYSLQAVSLLAVSAALISGCHSHNASNNAGATPPQAPPVARETPNVSQEQSKTPVRDSLTALLEQDAVGDHIFPAGVTVKSVVLSHGVVSIDFSRAFNALANSGETTES